MHAIARIKAPRERDRRITFSPRTRPRTRSEDSPDEAECSGILPHLPDDRVAVADFVIRFLESDFVESGPRMRLIEPMTNLSQ